MKPKAQATKEKIDKLDFIKIKNFHASKDSINRVKRQYIEWKKIFANYISNNGLISRLYKELLRKLNDIGLDDDFINLTPKTKATKAKIKASQRKLSTNEKVTY